MDGLNRLNRPTTQRDDPLTAAYVNAGLQLVEEALNHKPTDDTDGHPFLAWISQRRVVDTVNRMGHLPAEATISSLRDRWEPHGNYLWDLIDYIRIRRPSRSFPERARTLIRRLLLGRSSPSAVVRELGKELQEGVFANEFFRIQLLGLAVIGGSEYPLGGDGEKVSDLYRDIDDRWTSIVAQFLEKHNLDYRVGVTESDIIQLGTALTEGLAMRELADPTEGHRREERLRLHSTGLLALLHSLILPRELADDSISIDKAVNALLEQSSSTTSR